MIMNILLWALIIVALGTAAWIIWEMVREKRQLEDDLMREFGMACEEIANIPYRVHTRRTDADGTVYREGWCSGCNMPILPDKTCLCDELSLERYRRTKSYG